MSGRRARATVWVAWLLASIAVCIPVYAFRPVPTVWLESDEPVRIGPEVVHPGATLRWVRPGLSCFPDAPVLMLQQIAATLPDGSQWAWPTIGPEFNRRGACLADNEVDFVLTENFTQPGEFIVEFRFCTNAGQFLRERCVTAYSPTYILEEDR